MSTTCTNICGRSLSDGMVDIFDTILFFLSLDSSYFLRRDV